MIQSYPAARPLHSAAAGRLALHDIDVNGSYSSQPQLLHPSSPVV
uniref:Uncharacterized protein n=1 Tax=Anguilla anguilla TaxID=7936 RepID=A0A0E9SIX0_ANGAN